MRWNPLRGIGRRDLLENPGVDLVAALVGESNGGPLTASGLRPVTPERALRLSAVYAAVRVIAESCGSLPCPVYRRRGRSRERLEADPRWRLLNDEPNPEMTAVELLESWFGHALLWGRGYLYVDVDERLAPDGLWPLRPDVTKPKRTDAGELYYETLDAAGRKLQVPADRVLVLSSIFAQSPVRVGRDALAGALSAEEYAARFWSNNARPGGVIEIDGRMDEDEYEEFRRRWRAGHEGLSRSQLIGILTKGAKWKDIGVPPELAQFLETRQFGVREVARIFRVPPHMIADLEGTVTRASIEQQSIDFTTHTLRPWLVRAEQALKRRLFSSDADRAAGVYPQFDTTALMRGDTRARFEAYAKGIQFGFLSRSDAREAEGLAHVASLDEFLVPVNMQPAGAEPS